jgi:hypothetical protein
LARDESKTKTKSQTPNTKEAPNTKLQTTNSVSKLSAFLAAALDLGSMEFGV